MSFLRQVRETATHLQSGSGTIMNASSISVKETFGSLSLSSVVRMSEIGMAKILARDLGSEVRVNMGLAGIFETPRLIERIEKKVDEGTFESYEAGLDSYAEASPLNWIGGLTEIGEAITYLSSDRASFITGVALPVDGGATYSNL